MLYCPLSTLITVCKTHINIQCLSHHFYVFYWRNKTLLVHNLAIVSCIVGDLGIEAYFTMYLLLIPLNKYQLKPTNANIKRIFSQQQFLQLKSQIRLFRCKINLATQKLCSTMLEHNNCQQLKWANIIQSISIPGTLQRECGCRPNWLRSTRVIVVFHLTEIEAGINKPSEPAVTAFSLDVSHSSCKLPSRVMHMSNYTLRRQTAHSEFIRINLDFSLIKYPIIKCRTDTYTNSFFWILFTSYCIL